MSQCNLQWRADQKTQGAWRGGAGLYLRTVQACGAAQEQAGDWALGSRAASKCHAAAGAGCSTAGGEQYACAACGLGPVQKSCLTMPSRLTLHYCCHSVLRLSPQLAVTGVLGHVLCTSSLCLRCRALQLPALSLRSCSHPSAERAGSTPATLCCMTGLRLRMSTLASLTCDDVSAMLIVAAMMGCSLLPHIGDGCRLNLIALTDVFP